MSKKNEENRQVSFIDADVKLWLEGEVPKNGLCLQRFHADFTVRGLAEMKAGDLLTIENNTYELTMVGKKCFPECELLRETGKKCPLAGGAGFGKML